MDFAASDCKLVISQFVAAIGSYNNFLELLAVLQLNGASLFLYLFAYVLEHRESSLVMIVAKLIHLNFI